jgi:hypothetical protein
MSHLKGQRPEIVITRAAAAARVIKFAHNRNQSIAACLPPGRDGIYFHPEKMGKQPSYKGIHEKISGVSLILPVVATSHGYNV